MLDTHLVVGGPRPTRASGSSQVLQQLIQPLGNFIQDSHVRGNSWMTQADLWRKRPCSCVTGASGTGWGKNLLKPLRWNRLLKAKVEEHFMHHNQRWWQSVQEDGLITGDVRNDGWREPSWARLAGSAKGKHFGRNSWNQFILNR